MSKLLHVGDFDVQHTVTLTLAVILQPSPYFEKSWTEDSYSSRNHPTA